MTDYAALVASMGAQKTAADAFDALVAGILADVADLTADVATTKGDAATQGTVETDCDALTAKLDALAADVAAFKEQILLALFGAAGVPNLVHGGKTPY